MPTSHQESFDSSPFGPFSNLPHRLQPLKPSLHRNSLEAFKHSPVIQFQNNPRLRPPQGLLLQSLQLTLSEELSTLVLISSCPTTSKGSSSSFPETTVFVISHRPSRTHTRDERACCWNPLPLNFRETIWTPPHHPFCSVSWSGWSFTPCCTASSVCSQRTSWSPHSSYRITPTILKWILIYTSMAPKHLPQMQISVHHLLDTTVWYL